MHPPVMEFVAEQVEKYGPFGSVVEFGSLDINGSVRALFPPDQAYLGIDLQEGPGVDLIADAREADLPLCDLVICCEVLEHHPDAEGIIQAAYRCLHPRGMFVVTCAMDPRPAHSAIDESPIRDHEFYRNVDPGDLDRLLSEWSSREVFPHPDRGDLYAVAVR